MPNPARTSTLLFALLAGTFAVAQQTTERASNMALVGV